LDIDKLIACCIEEIKLANITESSLIEKDVVNASLNNIIHKLRKTFLSCWEQDQLPIVKDLAKKFKTAFLYLSCRSVGKVLVI
jgi:hypothetical protein